MTSHDTDALPPLSSTLHGGAYARSKLDGRQEVSSRMYEGAVRNTTKPHVGILSTIVTSRERAMADEGGRCEYGHRYAAEEPSEDN